jgi:hypothetical protein
MVDFDEAAVGVDEVYGEVIKRTEGSNKSRLRDKGLLQRRVFRNLVDSAQAIVFA